jgi:Mor family transcriptional regulator
MQKGQPMGWPLALVGHFQGEVLTVPKCQAAVLAVRNGAIRAAYDRGVTARELARRHDLTVRQVWNVLGRGEEVGERQGGLF